MASGSGSNAENLLRYALETKSYSVECMITDKPDAGVISRCEQFGVNCFIVPFKRIDKSETITQIKKRQERKVLKILEEREVTWVLLAGYMRILSKDFISHFWDKKKGLSRIINIHPALLPMFPGKDAYEQAWNAGVESSGITVHHVDGGIDTGPIILQQEFQRKPGDNLSSFKARGMEIEYELYKKAVDQLFTGENVHE